MKALVWIICIVISSFFITIIGTDPYSKMWATLILEPIGFAVAAAICANMDSPVKDYKPVDKIDITKIDLGE